MHRRPEYRDSIEEYLQELNPKYYQQLNKSGQLKEYLDNLTGWAVRTHTKMMCDEMERQIKNGLRRKGTGEQIQETEMIDLQVQEFVRQMLEEQVRR